MIHTLHMKVIAHEQETWQQVDGSKWMAASGRLSESNSGTEAQGRISVNRNQSEWQMNTVGRVNR